MADGAKRPKGPSSAFWLVFAVFWLVVAAAVWFSTDRVLTAVLAAAAGIFFLGAAASTQKKEREQG